MKGDMVKNDFVLWETMVRNLYSCYCKTNHMENNILCSVNGNVNVDALQVGTHTKRSIESVGTMVWRASKAYGMKTKPCGWVNHELL